MNQHTIKNSIKTKGIGLHTGTVSEITITTAPENTGIVFIKHHKNKTTVIPAHSIYVGNTQLSTDLTKDGATIRTIEHLMSALAGCGIDNAFINVMGDEVPALDGSAAPFCFLINEAGIVEQSAPRKFLKINKKIKVGDENGWAILEPYNGFKLDFAIEFNHPMIEKSSYSIDLDYRNFWKEISRARTFGFIKDVEKLHKMGAALGASTQNAIVLTEYSILNADLRYPDEFVRHKILDAIGDLYVSGYQIIGKYRAYASGHKINNMLLQAVFESNSAEIITMPNLTLNKNTFEKNYFNYTERTA